MKYLDTKKGSLEEAIQQSMSGVVAKDLLEAGGKYLKYSDLLLQKGRLMAKNKSTAMIDKEISKEMKKLGIKESKDEYERFFNSALKKFKIDSPADLKTDAKKKEFFNYVDKNYKAKAEGKVYEGGPGSGRPTKPGSARDIDKKMSAAADDANARLDAAEKAMKAKKKKVKEVSYSFSTTDKREQISPMGYNLLRKDVITLKDAVKSLERSVKKQHQADTHHDLIYLLTRAHEAYKNSKK
mgnify:CR=1 FL=1